MSKSVAFFSAEYALSSDLPIFSGGLGILAGDFLLEAGSLNLDFRAFGMMYHRTPLPENPAGFSLLQKDNQPVLIPIEFSDHTITAQIWVKEFGSAKAYLLDSDVPQNSIRDRQVMTSPYGPDATVMIHRQMIFSFGLIKLLRYLNFEPDVFHLNEGHTSFVVLALLLDLIKQHPGVAADQILETLIKPRVVATKHTIFTEAGIYLPRTELEQGYHYYLSDTGHDFAEFFNLGTDEKHPSLFSTTKLLLHSSIRNNGVSTLHVKFEAIAHPNSPLISITNGVCVSRWDKIGVDDIWTKHQKNKEELLKFVSAQSKIFLNPFALTIVWARRLAGYKRPELIFTDLERLSEVVGNQTWPVQIILAGNVHIDDPQSASTADRINDYINRNPRLTGKIVFIPSYDLETAKLYTSGADIWLNTPEVGKEACGTSGMKAGLNGALMMSTNDGWIGEVDWATTGGWVLPENDTAEAIYSLIEKEACPLFYQKNGQGIPENWVSRMEKIRQLILEKFSAKRMVRDYMEKLYFPEV